MGMTQLYIVASTVALKASLVLPRKQMGGLVCMWQSQSKICLPRWGTCMFHCLLSSFFLLKKLAELFASYAGKTQNKEEKKNQPRTEY